MYGSTRTLGLSYSEQVDQFQSYSTFSVHLKCFYQFLPSEMSFCTSVCRSVAGLAPLRRPAVL